MKFVLILSHGQSSVERSFSVNKNLLVEKLQESSLIAQRLLLDHMSGNCFEPHIFRIDRNLIRSVESSHQRYLQKFAENPKEIARKEREEKAKPTVAEVHSLDRERILHETTIKDLREESEADLMHLNELPMTSRQNWMHAWRERDYFLNRRMPKTLRFIFLVFYWLFLFHRTFCVYTCEISWDFWDSRDFGEVS